MNIKTVMVVGSGQMGAGIAQVCAHAGFTVYLHDMNEATVQNALRTMAKNLERQIQKARMTELEKTNIMERIFSSTQLHDAVNADVVIEAVTEKLDAKINIFSQLDQLAPPHTILATNTSSLPITELASATKRPEQVIGMHFMNPVPIMKLVEVIPGLQTANDVTDAIIAMAKKLNKVPVKVEDFPGFVSNRILMPMINEAIYVLYEGVAEKEAIDEVMRLGMNHPMGPLQLADFIGLDTCLYIMETLHEGFGDDKYRPCPLLRKYVKAGWLGRKVGKGFYQYQ